MNKTGAHVPPANPDHFSWLEIDETRNIVLSRDGQPLVSVTLRKIVGNRAALQITAVQGFPQSRDPRLTHPVEKSTPEQGPTPNEAKP